MDILSAAADVLTILASVFTIAMGSRHAHYSTPTDDCNGDEG
ncbi:hypothetical protein [Streptomyces sp. NPDC096339]